MKKRIFAALLAAILTLSLCGTALAEEVYDPAGYLKDADPFPADTPADEPDAEPSFEPATGTGEDAEAAAPREFYDPDAPEEVEQSEDEPEETPVIPPAESAQFAWCSDWARTELLSAQTAGLMPTVFTGADMRNNITRREFAALAVKFYEAVTGTTAVQAPAGAFSDTSDSEVMKAYALGIVNGFEDGSFRPEQWISRQDAAVMLVRAYKAAYWTGWTLRGDEDYVAASLDFGEVALYADHPRIGQYAYKSVYFLTKREVTKGVGDRFFAPEDYCTREQSVAMALRLLISGK